MLEEVILYGIGSAFLNIFCVYCWFSLLEQDVDWKSRRIWFAIMLMTIVGIISNIWCPQPIKIILSCIFLVIISFFVVNRNLKISVILVLISQMIIMISEFSFAVIVLFLFGNELESILLTPIVSIVSNIYITILSLLIIKTKIPKKIFNSIISSATLMKKREVLIYSIMIITVAIISTTETYMNWSLPVVLTTNTVMALIFIFMVIKFAKSEDKYNRVNSKYQTSITSLNEYGEILDKYRVCTHENKNQLLTIQKMTKDKNVIKYIDTLIDEKIKDNEKIMNKTFKIPEGSFRSIIYAKLCKIDELKIKYKLNISNDVKTADLINMNEFLVRDACTILGVYLDNAIEAVQDLQKKNIFVEIYIIDNHLFFDITNNFEGVLDIGKIDKPKYTTKGEGHGYGLPLVSKIVEGNKNINNECEVVNNMITQRVKIKM